ncbi:MAG: hypothetical protein IIC50_25930 [Planctomycetes bacterium]|nr:hypothetical protein [Planctomycetota bacterium]
MDLYCLMTSHVHYVLETAQGNLSRFIQRFQTAYTLYFNRGHNRHGHLLQGRFGASVVDEDEYTPALHKYEGMPSAYEMCFYHRELRGHREAIAAAFLFLSSATSVPSVVHHRSHRR